MAHAWDRTELLPWLESCAACFFVTPPPISSPEARSAIRGPHAPDEAGSRLLSGEPSNPIPDLQSVSSSRIASGNWSGWKLPLSHPRQLYFFARSLPLPHPRKRESVVRGPHAPDEPGSRRLSGEPPNPIPNLQSVTSCRIASGNWSGWKALPSLIPGGAKRHPGSTRAG